MLGALSLSCSQETQTPPAANAAAARQGNSVTAIIAAPPAPVVVTPANGSRTSDPTPTYSGTTEQGNTVTVSVLVDGVSLGTSTAVTGGTWAFTSTTPLTDGIHEVRATAADAQGNTSPESTPNTFTVDTTPPAAPAIYLPANGSRINDTTPTYSGTAEPSSTVVIIVDGTVVGSTTVDGSGNWSFTSPGLLVDGSHVVQATATDEVGNTGSQSNANTFTVDTVGPVATDDTLTVLEDSGPTAIDVLANDSTSSGTLTVTAVTQPFNGTVTLSGGVVRFTPASNFFGITGFTYTVSDGSGGTSTASVTVTVTPVNDPPDAVNDTFSVAQNSGTTPLDVLANDTAAPDQGETISVSAVTQPANATVVLTGGMVNFTPASNFSGTTSFSYTLSDGSGGTDTALVTVRVGLAAVTDAVDDSFTVARNGGATVLDVLANDSSASGTITLTAATQPANGTVSLTGGVLRFTPATNFVGTTNFTYIISDGIGGTDTATVTVTVTAVATNAVDDAFTVAEDSGTAALDVLANDASATGTRTVTSATQPANGSVFVSGGTLFFTAAPDFFGTTNFTYTLSDGNGGIDTAAVTVTVTPVNDPPTARDDSFSVMEDSEATELNLLANDSSAPDLGETLTIVAVTQPTGGTVTLSGGVVRFTPAETFVGTTYFTYTVSDGTGGSATAAVWMTVTVNSVLHAGNDAFTVADDSGPTVLNVLANDSSASGTLIITSVTQPASGTVSLSGGVLRFTPAPNFLGNMSFLYTVSNGSGATDTARVTVTVRLECVD
ncbi:Ig-like domain-containing protein [Hyalangium minutum]|nr:Ig-like domain-containing protein [Hyalangium minutum]